MYANGNLNQVSSFNQSGLTNDQIMQMMQAKREKLNNSALVGSSNEASLITGTNMMLQNTSSIQSNMKQMQNQRRTPTSLVAGSGQEQMNNQHLNNTQLMSQFNTQGQSKASMSNQRQSKDKNLKITHQSILNQHLQEIPLPSSSNAAKNQLSMNHHMNFSTNQSGSNTSKAHMAGHLHQRTGSQLSSHANQLMFMDSQSTQAINQLNRKSSIEAKIGGQAAVSGVVKSN